MGRYPLTIFQYPQTGDIVRNLDMIKKIPRDTLGVVMESSDPKPEENCFRFCVRINWGPHGVTNLWFRKHSELSGRLEVVTPFRRACDETIR